jgi:DNA-directed RNA polymerase specialized sigma24 family protein
MWTSEADAELRALKAAGLSFAQIAERMGVSRNAAISRFQRINGKRYPRSRAQRLISQVHAERRELEKRQEEEMRKMFASVNGKDRRIFILGAHAAGMSNAAIARAAGVTNERIRQILSAARRGQQAASHQLEQRGEMN